MKSKESVQAGVLSVDRQAGTIVNVNNTSFLSKLLQRIELEPQPGSFAPGRWSNKDLDPVSVKDRTWRTYNYALYWVSDAFAPGNWRLGSSLIILGLSWKLTLAIVALGHILISLVITLNGVVGARLHVAFAVQSRAAFGFYFSFVMVVIRMIVGVFWYGINCYTGAECVRSMVYACWPRFRNIPNQLPESANITTQMMICYFLYFCLVLPFHCIPTRHIRWFFTFKSVFTPIAGFAIMGWLIHKTGGTDTPIFSQGSTLKGSELTWAFMNGLNAMLGNYATLAVNINDFTRFAKKQHMTYIQIFIIPTCFLIMAFWGIVGAGATQIIYGEVLWDPLLVVDRWTSPGGRAAAFFCGLAFCIAQIGANVSANSVAAANDLNALVPKYINIRRGQILVAFVGAWVLTPWDILTSAAGLVNFMSGYTIWLAPIAGILLADYYVLRRQTLDLAEMYRPGGKYMYNKYGTNWRAVVAFNIGWIPLMPGFAQSVSSTVHLSVGAVHFYNLGYFYGFGSSFVIYALLSHFWVPRETLVLA